MGRWAHRTPHHGDKLPYGQRQTSFDLKKYIAMGIEAELQALKVTQRKLEAQLKRFRKGGRLGQPRIQAAPSTGTRPKRVMSAAAKKAIGRAQKKRWAKWRKEQASA
jgi:hypothetical protein